MKIIVLTDRKRYGLQNKKQDIPLILQGVSLPADRIPVVHTLPDTTLLRDSRPFFVPDYARPCVYEMSLVLRVCRLGKCISSKYAGRYYDAVTMGVAFTALNLFTKCREEGLPWEISTGFDGSAAMGKFVPLPESGTADGFPRLRLCCNGEEVDCASAGHVMADADEYLAYVSNFYTLRQGDLLCLMCGSVQSEAVIDTRLTGFIGEEEVLSFNIK